MTTPDEDDVRTALQHALAAAERSAPTIDPRQVRERARRRVPAVRLPRLDLIIVATVGLALILVVALLLGPLRPSSRTPNRTPPASGPSTSISTPSTTTATSTPAGTMVLVPQVVGQQLTDAIAVLSGINLTYRVTYAQSNQPDGQVLAENPGAGSSVKAASRVVLTVSHQAPPTGTQVITYQPFTSSGAIDPTLQVIARYAGSCQEGETDRTWRCFSNAFSGNGIYDPCFAGPHGTSDPLVCPRDPTTPDVVEFTATSATPPSSLNDRTTPWALQLTNGTVCEFVNAAWGGLGPYDCQVYDASASPADCHVPQQAKPLWTVACQEEKTDASPFTTYGARTVWH